MDYKYIEQLLDRYWECQTTLEEEAILRTFFAQDSVPVELLKYRKFFTAQKKEVETLKLDDAFDEKIMQIIEEQQPVKARTITLTERMRPFFRAAAIIAITVTLGTAAQKAMDSTDAPYPTSTTRHDVKQGTPVALSDSIKADTAKVVGATTTQVTIQ